MDEADAQEAARFLHSQMLGEIEGVVIAVPGKDAALAEFGGEFERGVMFDSQGDGAAGSVMP